MIRGLAVLYGPHRRSGAHGAVFVRVDGRGGFRMAGTINESRVYAVLLMIATIPAIIIFNSPEIFVEYFDTAFFCSDSSGVEIYYWIFPKLIAHCDMFFELAIFDKYTQGIVIVLDFYMCGIFFISLLIFIIVENNNYQKFKLAYLKDSLLYLIFRLFMSMIMISFIFTLTFVYPVHLVADVDDRLPFFALLYDYGIGAALQACFTMIGPYSFAMIITIVRVLRERSGATHCD